MDLSKRLAKLILLFLSATTWSGAAAIAGLSQHEKEGILQFHNAVRSRAAPRAPPTNMLELGWDDTLASLAQSTSRRCPHAQKGERNVFDYMFTSGRLTVGENILIFNSSELVDSSFGQVLQAHWFDSLFLQLTLCVGRTCFNYYQIVFAETEVVGCGATTCNNMVVIVCHYVPSPVSIIAQNPYQTGGERCSQCPPHAPNCTANGGLCTGTEKFVLFANISTSDVCLTSAPVSGTPLSVTPSSTFTSSEMNRVYISTAQPSVHLNLNASASRSPSPTLITSVDVTNEPVPSTSILTTGTATSNTRATPSTESMSRTSTSTYIVMPTSSISASHSQVDVGESYSTSISTHRTSVSSVSSVVTEADMSTTYSPVTPSPVVHTVTVTQTLDGYCPCEEEEFRGRCADTSDRLPLLYVVIIGVIPSTIALALFFVLIIAVSASYKRKSGNVNKNVYRFQSPQHQSRQRRMRIQDTVVPANSQALPIHHLRPVSPPSVSNLQNVDMAFLHEPPTPAEEGDPARGNTFSILVPTTNLQESSFSSYSEPPSQSTFQEEPTRQLEQPTMGLESIHEEWEEERVEFGPGGATNINPRLEQGLGKGKIITTEC